MCVWVYVVCVVTFKSSKRLRGEREICTELRIKTERVGGRRESLVYERK
jgi:hypothetical protein